MDNHYYRSGNDEDLCKNGSEVTDRRAERVACAGGS